ncbi:MAG: hypothetical protein Q7T73_12470 [Beijerinckiaceae bacterium]|nr:hypothetical protein [Beijerinckiaceae bacterium]
MKTRLAISVLVFMMVQAVLFGVGTIVVLTTTLAASAMELMPWVIGLSLIISVPVSWIIAPRLQRRYWAARGVPEAPPI